MCGYLYSELELRRALSSLFCWGIIIFSSNNFSNGYGRAGLLSISFSTTLELCTIHTTTSHYLEQHYYTTIIIFIIIILFTTTMKAKKICSQVSDSLRSLAAQHERRLQRRKCTSPLVYGRFAARRLTLYPPVDVHTRRACLISRTANAYRARPPDI